ncbi:protein of unknown function [Pararobbsia alpina]
MKNKVPICLNVLSPKSMFHADDFINAVRLYSDLLPRVLPEKWGWWEPLNRNFDVRELEQLVPQSGRCETVYWKRKQSPKADGSFNVRWLSKSPRVGDTHSNINFAVESSKIDQDTLVRWMKATCISTRADLALVRSWCIQRVPLYELWLQHQHNGRFKKHK